MKVFLGGTCNGSLWRHELQPKLKELGVDYFNPVVLNWDDEAQEEEIKQREQCDVLLYVITPYMKGVYSIGEVVDDSNKRPHKTILCILPEDNDHVFSTPQLHSLNQIEEMVVDNGGTACNGLKGIVTALIGRLIKE